ncbi:MAG: endonuclease domain-containing protein [Flavobacteriales bacterium]|nr:endonuclease domain-containing protein [Flavobacteriales bacterium]
MGSFHNSVRLKHIRKGLRTEGTSAEATPWSCLRNKQLDGLKFRRQHSLGPHIIVDLYCPEVRLAIELDGKEHADPIGSVNDGERDEFLKERGIKVLRFENQEILEDPELVLEAIRVVAKEWLPTVKSPPVRHLASAEFRRPSSGRGTDPPNV